MIEIKDRLQEALHIRNITRTELSTLSGVPKPMITDYIKGRYKPKQDNIYALSKALRVNPAWFMGYEDADIDDLSYLEQGKTNVSVITKKESSQLIPIPRNEKLDIGLYKIATDFQKAESILKKKIPMLGKIACGEPIYADEDFDTFIEVNSDLKADFCLTCSGDSMINANIFDGDIVFIQKQDIVDNGQIAAVIIEDEATLKRVYYDRKNGRLILQAENPKYSPLIYIGEELNNIRILGRAISLYRKIK